MPRESGCAIQAKLAKVWLVREGNVAEMERRKRRRTLRLKFDRRRIAFPFLHVVRGISSRRALEYGEPIDEPETSWVGKGGSYLFSNLGHF